MNPILAAKAYGAAQSQFNKISGGEEAGGTPDIGSKFSSLLQNTVQQTYASTANAENQIALQAQGKTELIDAVTAISSAEASLETVIAVRDQVIAAYQEIMRMPI
ncbi:flagellar hook-basal body complex protein FliE [Asticcacaulis sp. ZE23SCel15]|uniref:flagellar hook-basal body complex protein FliE n=1 Tax=unclassified Asticcacaulis TaxID=2628350 RepID=UPI00226CBE89|nr:MULTISPECIES: flagellar hook-basal body complex protein FliE [unclassified Asticcacaulis]WAC48063.1 flagellar hook-basal body complex protein FliE [Asticcacaulis sp. SL142]WKL57540.1 flagellar hook-basal body complex protein FliE [Asticcacaulis sp. ZE23SCel15]